MTRVFRICLALLFVVWSGISAAQQSDGDENPLYPFWDEFAARAEERVTAAQDSNEEFEELRLLGEQLGFSNVASGPMVRSSYHADLQANPVLGD